MLQMFSNSIFLRSETRINSIMLILLCLCDVLASKYTFYLFSPQKQLKFLILLLLCLNIFVCTKTCKTLLGFGIVYLQDIYIFVVGLWFENIYKIIYM